MPSAGPALRPSSERKRQAILDAARSRFVSMGFDPVTIDDVAADAQVSKQTVYSHFGSKEGLFVEVISTATTGVFVGLSDDAADPTTRDELERFLTAYGLRQLDGVLHEDVIALRRLVIAEQRRFPQMGVAFWDNGPQQAMAALAGLMRRLQRAGLLRSGNAVVAARTFNWLVMSEPLNRAMLLGETPDARSRRASVREAVRVFLAAWS